LGVKFRLGAINAVTPDDKQGVPSGILGVESIMITPATEPGPLVYDPATGLPLPGSVGMTFHAVAPATAKSRRKRAK
jgi:hypothetical protein